MEARQNSVYINLLKGIGILWVVLGHACITRYYTVPIREAVQITIFFWVAGYTYNKNKYANNVAALVGNRVHKFFIPYLGYMILLLVLHNIFCDIGVIFDYEAVKYTGIKDYLSALCNYCTFSYEVLCGPLWFMAPFLISQALYGNIVHFIRMRFEERRKYWLWLMVASCISGILGIIMVENGVVAYYRGEVACMMIPIMVIGNFVSEFNLVSSRIFNIFGGIIALGIIYIIWGVTGKIVNISLNEIINPVFFYTIVFCGIYFTAWMAKKLIELKVLNCFVCILNLLGKYSMDIMIMHIMFFRIMFAGYNHIVRDGRGEYISFLEGHSVLCVIVGLAGPILLRKIAHTLYEKFCHIYCIKDLCK